jgi:hypothetical protein
MSAKTLIDKARDIDYSDELENFLLSGIVEWQITWVRQNDDPMDENNDVNFCLLVTKPKIGMITMAGTSFSHELPTAKVYDEYKNTIDFSGIRKARIWEDHLSDAGLTSLTRQDIVETGEQKALNNN